MAEGPITKNGIHPITHHKATIHAHGHKGSTAAATPKPAQVAGEGAKPGGAGGAHMPAGKDTAPLAGHAGTKTAGSTKEEQAGKTLADKFYPAKRPGLKGKMEG